MRAGILVFGFILSSCSLGRMGMGSDESEPTDTSPTLKELPAPFEGGKYRVDPYIRAAAALQALGKEKACQNLAAAAQDGKNDNKVIVLCRILFTEKKGGKFRRPAIGAAAFIGDTDYRDWPREPIELVDGVPFLIARGYLLAGKAETASSYLGYCMKDCEWSSYKYEKNSDAEKQKALNKLMTSKKWKKPLEDQDREFLSSQIR